MTIKYEVGDFIAEYPEVLTGITNGAFEAEYEPFTPEVEIVHVYAPLDDVQVIYSSVTYILKD